MTGPFDITLKHLMEAYPRDWLKLAGLETSGPVEVLDAELATVEAQADKVIRISDPAPWMIHVEVQSTYSPALADRIHVYNALLSRRHNLPVRSVLVLLRESADGRNMDGVLERHDPLGQRYLEFRYDAVRIWRLPSETLLSAGLGVLPLAPLTDDSQEKTTEIVRQMESRVSVEADKVRQANFWAATYVLLGLRFSDGVARALLHGVQAMKESTTYQAIIAEGKALGREEGQRQSLLTFGAARFGPAPEKVRRQIEAVRGERQLEKLIERVGLVDSWEALLDEEKPG